MNSRRSQSSLANRSAYSIIAIASVALIVPASRETLAQTPPATNPLRYSTRRIPKRRKPLRRFPTPNWILSWPADRTLS